MFVLQFGQLIGRLPSFENYLEYVPSNADLIVAISRVNFRSEFLEIFCCCFVCIILHQTEGSAFFIEGVFWAEQIYLASYLKAVWFTMIMIFGII